MRPYLANTDPAWFDFLADVAARMTTQPRCVSEVNFWFPTSREPPLRSIAPGTPVFLRRKSPDCAIAGVGFFASLRMLPLDDAWLAFGIGNGDPDESRFRKRIRAYRNRTAAGPQELDRPLACMALRAAEFWPRAKWIPWREAEGFQPQIVTGKYEEDPARIAILMAAIGDARAVRDEEFAEKFVLPTTDDRDWREAARQLVREGQSTFRLRLLDAYGSQCAITGEHTTPVLDAAHIVPYSGPRSNHVQNGILLTKEFHALFDRGYVAISPDDLTVRVSPRLRSEFQNGHRYYPYDERPLARLPDDAARRPSREALDWHMRRVFLAG